MKSVYWRETCRLVAVGVIGLFWHAQVFGASLDQSFNASPNGFVSTLASQPDGKVLVGGNFTAINGVARRYLARLNADGSVDGSFAPSNGPAEFVARIVARDGKIYAAAGDGMHRFDLSGARDWTYPMSVPAFDVDSQQRAVFGGQFIRVEGQYHRNIARLTADGILDATFSPAVGSAAGESVNAILAQGDSVFAGGYFQTVNGSVATHFAKINADGSLNSALSADPPVLALAATADGKILRASQQTLARHLADGSLDSSFTGVSAGGSSDDRFVTVAATPDGKAIVGGKFTLNGSPAYLACFNADGSLDSTFSIQPNDIVTAIAVQPDGSLIIGGHFTTVNGVERAGLARVVIPESTLAQPVLEISAAGAGHVALTWPSGSSFVLETRGLGDTAWTAVNAQPTTANGKNCVTNPCTTGGRIFRLRAQP
jgi:uncharacterized delta-60 repeat protein